MKKNGKYCNGKKSLNMKPLALLLALALVVGGVVGGTIAWLTAQTGPVTNTFTVGDINIGIGETGNGTYDFVPGDKLAKNPWVSVTAGSEACYLFVKVTVADNSATDNMSTEDTADDVTVNPVVNFAVDNGWKYINSSGVETTMPAGFKFVDGTYYFYRTVAAATADVSYFVLAGEGDATYKDGYVTIDEHVTKGMVAALTEHKPTIAFQAAAIQMDNVETLAEAWTNLPAAFKPTT